jgi:ADP-ribosylglycohydrolase
MKLSSTTCIANQACLFGAIAGDMIGSSHEWKVCTDPQFALFSKSSKFTDDSVLTIAVADAIINKRGYG